MSENLVIIVEIFDEKVKYHMIDLNKTTLHALKK